LRPAGVSLILGEEPNATEVSGAAETNNLLWTTLGVTKKQLDDYVFVKQRGIDALIEKKPADRGQELEALFGLTKAERVWTALGQFASAVEIPTSAFDADKLRETITEVELTIRTLQANIDAYDVPEDVPAYVRERDALVQAYNNAAACKKTISQQIDAVIDLKNQDAALSPAIDQHTHDIQLFESALTAEADRVQQANAQLQRWHAYKSSESLRAQWVNDRTHLTQLWQSRPQWPVRPASYIPPGADRDAAAAKHEQLHSQVIHVGATVNTLRRESGNAGQPCPTCKQPLPDVSSLLAEKEAELEVLQEELAPLATALNHSNTYDSAVQHCREQREQVRQVSKRLRQQRDNLQHLDRPAESEESLQAVLQESAELTTALQDARQALHKKTAERARIEGQIVSVENAMTAEKQRLNEMPSYTHEQAQQAHREAVEAQNAAQQRDGLLAQLRAAQARRDVAQSQLDDIAAVSDRADRTRAALEHLNAIRGVLHRDSAPKIVLFTYLEQMRDDINEVLGVFDAPFRVDPDDSLGFTASYLDGSWTGPDRELSVGERIVLSMAFRITVNSTFAGSLGLLILDEPTAGLDEHNLGCLPRALERLRELSAARGLQVLFVTHEPRIGYLFDKVIEIA